jgi:hypothetical protein
MFLSIIGASPVLEIIDSGATVSHHSPDDWLRQNSVPVFPDNWQASSTIVGSHERRWRFSGADIRGTSGVEKLSLRLGLFGEAL